VAGRAAAKQDETKARSHPKRKEGLEAVLALAGRSRRLWIGQISSPSWLTCLHRADGVLIASTGRSPTPPGQRELVAEGLPPPCARLRRTRTPDASRLLPQGSMSPITLARHAPGTVSWCSGGSLAQASGRVASCPARARPCCCSLALISWPYLSPELSTGIDRMTLLESC